MASDEYNDILRSTHPEEIWQDYINGDITAEVRNKTLRAKAKLSVSDVLAKEGYIGAVWKLTMEHAQENWDYLVAGAKEDMKWREQNPNLVRPMHDLGALVHGAYATIKMLMAPIDAFGEVNGAMAENYALANGASPSLARVIRIGTELGSNFIPVSKGAKAIVGVGSKLGEIAGVGEAAVKGAEKLAATGGKISPLAERAIKEGLKLEDINLEAKSAEGTYTASKIGGEAGKSASSQVGTKGSPSQSIEPPLNRARKRPPLPRPATSPPPEPLGAGQLALANVASKFGAEVTDVQLRTLSKLARKALSSGTQDNEIAFARYAAALFSPQTPGGRINYSSQMMNLLTEWAPQHIANGDIRSAMQELAKDLTVGVLPIGGGARQFVERARAQGGFFPGMHQVYRNILLPFSWAAAGVGNSMAIASSLAEQFTTSPKQALYMAKGMQIAWSDGAHSFAGMFKKLPPEELGRFDFPVRNIIPGKIGRVAIGEAINVPTKLVAGTDAWFKTMNYRGYLYAAALREGELKGYKGEQLGRYVKWYQTHAPVQVTEQAEQFAFRNTFQNDLMPIARAVQNLVMKIPGGRYYFPFMRASTNLVKFSWDRTPVLQFISAQLYKDIAAGGARAEAATGRLIMANMMGFMISELAKEGYITGTGPADPRLRAEWLATHERNSIWVGKGMPGTPGGGKWMPYSGIEPFAHTLGMIADYTAIMDQLDDAKSEQMAHAIVYSVLSNLTNSSWWGQMSEIGRAVQEGVEGEKRLEEAKKLAMAPIVGAAGGPLLHRMARVVDPVSREARTWQDQVINGIPGYSKSLPPRRDWTGEPLVPAQPVLSTWFGMLGQQWPRTKDQTTNPLKLEADRLKVPISKWRDTSGGFVQGPMDIKGVNPGDSVGTRLSPEEEDQRWEYFVDILNHPKVGLEAQTLDKDRYQNANWAAQRSMFESGVQGIRNLADKQLFLNNKDVGERILRSEAAPQLQKLDGAAREAAEARVERSIRAYQTRDPEHLNNLLKFGDMSSEDANTQEPLQLRVTPSE